MPMQRMRPLQPPPGEQVSLWRRLFHSRSAGTIAAVSRMADDHVQGWPTTELIDDDARFEARAWADTEWADTQPSDLGDLGDL